MYFYPLILKILHTEDFMLLNQKLRNCNHTLERYLQKLVDKQVKVVPAVTFNQCCCCCCYHFLNSVIHSTHLPLCQSYPVFLKQGVSTHLRINNFFQVCCSIILRFLFLKINIQICDIKIEIF